MVKEAVRLGIFVLSCSTLMLNAATDTVTVTGGQIAGTTVNGIRVFKGIPFAAPPVGELRWRPPQPVAMWSGVRKADTFGPECTQTPYPPGSPYARPMEKVSEDCLYLNVWTGANAGERR